MSLMIETSLVSNCYKKAIIFLKNYFFISQTIALMNYDLLKILIGQLQSYEQEAQESNPSLADFILWLNKKLDKNDTEQTKTTGIPLDGLLMAYISNLYKYVKHYAKKVLENSPLVGLDDFVFLLSVRYNPSLSKSDLIQKHILEISSGMEILKRLQKESLVEEIGSEMDKRKKILRLTSLGEALLESLLPKVGQLASLTSANLSQNDKIRLLQSLKYLDDFHQHIFQQKNFKNLSFEEIIEQKDTGI